QPPLAPSHAAARGAPLHPCVLFAPLPRISRVGGSFLACTRGRAACSGTPRAVCRSPAPIGPTASGHAPRRHANRERAADAGRAVHGDVTTQEAGQPPSETEAQARAALRPCRRLLRLPERVEDVL